jgi:hypothetical protein
MLLLIVLDELDEVRVIGGSLTPSIGKGSGACGWPVAADKRVRPTAIDGETLPIATNLPTNQMRRV